MTLALVWQEYKAAHPEGLQYSWFCDQYRAWASKLDVVMRQEHRAGEKLFVDYAGRTVAVVDRHTGELRQAQVFVAVLGASNYTFAEATWTQTLPDWVASHVRAFEFLGGCSELVIPDDVPRNIIWNPAFRFTASRSPLPARNDTDRDAGTTMLSPVAGLWPACAGRSFAANAPNPESRTASPRASDRVQRGSHRRVRRRRGQPRLTGHLPDQFQPVHPVSPACRSRYQRAVAVNPIPCSGGTSSLALSRRRASSENSSDPGPDPA